MDFKIKETGCTVIFGGEKEQRTKIAAEFLRKNPQFKIELNPKLVKTKKKLFGKYKSTPEVLMKDLAKSRRREVMELIIKESKHVALDFYLDRAPRALSNGQKERWSMFYDALMGKRCFFFNDDSVVYVVTTARIMTKWLKKYTGGKAQIVWLTSLPKHQMVIEEFGVVEHGDAFLEIRGDELVSVEKSYFFPEPEPEPVVEAPRRLKRTHRVPKPEQETAPAPKPEPAPAPKPEPKPEPVRDNQDTVSKIMAMRNAYLNKK